MEKVPRDYAMRLIYEFWKTQLLRARGIYEIHILQVFLDCKNSMLTRTSESKIDKKYEMKGF